MGNNSSTSGRREGSFWQGRTRSALSALRRRLRSRRSYTASQVERQFDFQRLLGEDFQTDNASLRRAATPLITLNLSYHQDENECTIFVTGRDSSWEKIMEATVVEDLKGDYPSETFVTVFSDTGKVSTKFESPVSATYIKTFFQDILAQVYSD